MKLIPTTITSSFFQNGETTDVKYIREETHNDVVNQYKHRIEVLKKEIEKHMSCEFINFQNSGYKGTPYHSQMCLKCKLLRDG